MLDDLDATCPDCGSTVRFTLEDVARERTVRCSGGCSVELRDEGGGARDTKRALDDLDRSLEGLSRTIKFRL